MSKLPVPKAQQWMQYKLYIPRNPAEPRHNLHTEIMRKVAGLTITEGLGAWKSGSGDVITEPVFVWEIYTQKPLEEFWFHKVLREYCEDAMQECVMYTLDNVPHFLYP